jgi:hypothetical protein
MLNEWMCPILARNPQQQTITKQNNFKGFLVAIGTILT